MGCGGLVQALMGLLAVPEPTGLAPAADAPRLPCLCWALLPAVATSDGECGKLLLISFCPSPRLPQASPGRTGHGAGHGLQDQAGLGAGRGEAPHTCKGTPKPDSSDSPHAPCVLLTWGLPLDVVLSHRVAVQRMLQGT